jgi:hypothetical protein
METFEYNGKRMLLTTEIERVRKFLSTSINFEELFDKFLVNYYNNYNKEMKIKDVKLYYDIITSGVTCNHPSNIAFVTTVGGRLKFTLFDNRIYYEEGDLPEFDNIRNMFHDKINYNIIYCYTYLTLSYDKKFIVTNKINFQNFIKKF